MKWNLKPKFNEWLPSYSCKNYLVIYVKYHITNVCRYSKSLDIFTTIINFKCCPYVFQVFFLSNSFSEVNKSFQKFSLSWNHSQKSFCSGIITEFFFYSLIITEIIPFLQSFRKFSFSWNRYQKPFFSGILHTFFSAVQSLLFPSILSEILSVIEPFPKAFLSMNHYRHFFCSLNHSRNYFFPSIVPEILSF